jgi:hypothetical protein
MKIMKLSHVMNVFEITKRSKSRNMPGQYGIPRGCKIWTVFGLQWRKCNLYQSMIKKYAIQVDESDYNEL